jgi:hypothetical protein
VSIVAAIANYHCPLIGHGDKRILDTNGVLVQSYQCILSGAVQVDVDVLACIDEK